MALLPLSITLFLLLLATSIHAAADPRKLDETSSDIPGSEKCTPCDPTPPPPPPACPPPPPPVLPPPPPALPPPSPPPPKNPPSANCPPPPSPPSSSSIIYITGPPGNLYPVDDDMSGSHRTSVQTAAVAIGCGIVAAIVRFGI
ncbi:hypothetical protein LINGRAHAP2_LOCUS29580 [Linum grandiflorum]